MLLILTLYILRGPILRGIGNFLVVEDEINQVDAAFVLSGGSYERAKEAAKIYKSGQTSLLITTGEMESKVLKIVGMSMTDAMLSRRALIELGVPDSLIITLERGSSTFEESEEILGYAKQSGYQRIAIVSSDFHTRRVGWVFRRKFKKAGIDVLIAGAPPEDYAISEWWEHEAGMIFVNNEYVKLLYYMWKY